MRKVAAIRFDEGYYRGIHDNDAALILGALLPIRDAAGPLRFSPSSRAYSCLFWSLYDDAQKRRLGIGGPIALDVCARLVFMKVNGPSLGHAVTSLDPEEVSNATAWQEVDKTSGSRIWAAMIKIQRPK